MAYSSELKTSSRERKTSKMFEEKFATPRAYRNSKFTDFPRTEQTFGQRYPGWHHEVKQSTNQGHATKLEFTANGRQESCGNKSKKDDELVKHMRNVPGYLQRPEKGESIQEKAFNVGVLDWGRLENWKSNEKHVSPKSNKKTSSSSSIPSFVRHGPVTLPKTSLNKTLASRKIQPSSSLSCEKGLPRGGKAARPLNFESAGRTLDRDKNACQKSTDQISSSGKETSSSGLSKTILQEDKNLAHEHCVRGHQIAILSSPIDCPSNCRSFQLLDSLVDENVTEDNERRFSDCFPSDELHYVDPFPDAPHSCPLPLGVESTSEPAFQNETPLIQSKYLKERLSVVEPSASSSKTFDQDIAGQSARRGRHPSPIRRLSFGLGKMTRSFSFKESSSVGSEISEAFTPLNNSSGNKANASKRSSSSPLRRLLDPLLKSKGTHPSEKPSKRSLNFSSVEPINKGDLLPGKPEPSSVRALLQLTMKNGIPFFKLVVDSSHDMLAAAVKKLPAYGKQDSSLIYAIYSVHEMKKKNGNWITQGSREKSDGFGYNMVGQLRITSSESSDFLDLIKHNRKDQYMMRESVLFSVDQKTSGFTPNSELAAVVIKNRMNNSAHGKVECSKSTVVILPVGIHGLPNCGEPSPLISRWRCGGACDCGGWDSGCKLRVLTDQDEMVKSQRPSTASSASSCLDLCYQGKKIFSLAPLRKGLYSLNYDTPMSLLQTFSICVAVVSNQELAHVFPANNISEESFVTCPPSSPVGRV